MINYYIKLPENYVKTALPKGKIWVEALRSGNFPQGTDALCKDGNYCCLGVLCEIANLKLGEFTAEGSTYVQYGNSKSTQSTTVLPEGCEFYDALKSIGYFPGRATVYVENSPFYDLATINDKGVTFAQIADIIEAVWELQ